MKLLFDIGHPAHVHLFKNFIFYLNENNIPYIVVTRDKEITNDLLRFYKIPHKNLSVPGKNKLTMLKELFIRGFKIWKIHSKEHFSLALGTSVTIGHLSYVTKNRVKSFNFNEDDDNIVPLYTKLAYPNATKIINPDCLKFNKWKDKRVLVSSYHELAYLHPNNFTPNESILEKYGLSKGKYVIFRLSALKAHHDLGAKGISKELKAKMISLLDGYDIVESLEGKTGNKIEPWDMHHILAFAKMIVSDSQTMTIEAAVLGIPSMRINTFIGKSTVIDELEQKYKLSFGILPENESLIMSTLQSLIKNKELESQWQLKREKLLKDKVDFNKWMIDFFEKEI